MLKYELATSLTLNIEKYCFSYLNGLADLWCLRGGTRRREFRYIYKPGNPSRTRGRAYLFHDFLTTTRTFNEIQRSILLIMIICEILLFSFYLFWFWELKSTKTGTGALKAALQTAKQTIALLFWKHRCSNAKYNLVGIFWPVNKNNNTLV